MPSDYNSIHGVSIEYPCSIHGVFTEYPWSIHGVNSRGHMQHYLILCNTSGRLATSSVYLFADGGRVGVNTSTINPIVWQDVVLWYVERKSAARSQVLPLFDFYMHGVIQYIGA